MGDTRGDARSSHYSSYGLEMTAEPQTPKSDALSVGCPFLEVFQDSQILITKAAGSTKGSPYQLPNTAQALLMRFLQDAPNGL